MPKLWRDLEQEDPDFDAPRPTGPTPGKSSLTSRLAGVMPVSLLRELGAGPRIMRKRSGGGVGPDPKAAIASAQGEAGAPIPEDPRLGFSRSLGVDLDAVRVHTGSAAAGAAASVGARAFTLGNHIYFGAGQYNPSNPEGKTLLAHEVVHTVQQSSTGGSAGSAQFKLEVSQPGDSLEVEADRLAADVVAGRAATVSGRAAAALQLATLEGGGSTWEVRVDRVVPEGGRPPSTSGVIAYSGTEGATLSHSDVETAMGLPPDSLEPAEPMRCYDGASVAAFAPARPSAESEGSEGGARAEGSSRSDVMGRARAWISQRDQQMAAEAEERNAAWAPFRASFNTEFAEILTQLGGGEDGMTVEQLQQMFTEHQRELLQQYMTPAHPIPEGLFNGSERGGATAQQRILISSHMLVHGNYQHRDDAEGREPETGTVHAGSCGNWARLVLDYAGASPPPGSNGRDVLPNRGPDYGHLRNEEANIEGERDRSALHGRDRAGAAPGDYTDYTPEGLSEEDTAAWERRNARRRRTAGARIPRERLDGLQPGDWIYIFNDQGRRTLSSYGQHSLIFIRWLRRPSMNEREGYYYGRAVTQDQLSPAEGGQQHEINLGDHYRQSRPRIFPVTNVVRVTENTGPAQPQDTGGEPPGD